MGLHSVQAITFDGDGTLWDFETAMADALERAAAALREAGLAQAEGLAVSADWLRSVRNEVAAEEAMRRRTMEEIRRASFAEAIRRCEGASGRHDSALCDKVYEDYMRDRFALMELFGEVRDALALLSGRFRLALVTNGNTTPNRIGLDGIFDTVVLAQECGIFKPDPEIYAHTARLLQVAPSDCLHVGDHPVEDVTAAAQAGMRTVWLNRDGRTDARADGADLKASDLRELITYLDATGMKASICDG